MAKLTQEDILAYLEEATILELNDLVSAIEDKFGVVAAAAVAAPAADEAAADEGPSEVTVTLTDIGQTKVAVIKAVRSITGLGLVDAKKLVDSAPCAIKENIDPEEADKIKEELVAAGATVEVK
ncbi:50S ribosomal protein L7/L12 [Catenisphaera adipataccumulans]|jgi:large subunit ribosomal protein L7/L12|uniref:Large ribosomal subunit protein bL12 n=1 Tax=Catenisphaera adipataccumulans TaxID=700500 RepID=A0A7W8D0X2_9FIRM|nr:50S ribosomal protein L7/L12 [Catenisphaera adipataccumulans]MBB5183515.1 large subunit ribosomal protein L7/L12 [Catenisphaera adipataccumulans]